MLLTLKPPLLGTGSTIDSTPRASSPPYRNVPSASSTPRFPKTTCQYPSRHEQMTPSSIPREHPADSAHRNLPPPMTMSHSNSERGLPALGQMPPSSVSHLPSSQVQQSEESTRLWYQTKAEEERRRQEEERTRQESLKLDQRKIEQAMLRDSLQAGVPPYMVPFIFAGLGGGNLQWAQQYISQMSTATGQAPPQQLQGPSHAQAGHSQQQEYHPPQPRPAPQSLPTQPPPQQQTPLDVPRDNRMIPPNPYAASRSIPAAVARPPVQQTPPSPAQSPYTRVSPQSHPSSIVQSTIPLSRLSSAEMHIQHPPVNSGLRSSMVANCRPSQLQQSTSVKQELQQAQSSPGIYFHHWIPPSNPNTPSGKSPNISPNSNHPHSHLRSEYQNSPKKRKSQGNHPSVPPPPSQLSESCSTEPPSGRLSQSGKRNSGHAVQRNGSMSQINETAATSQSDPGRTSGQMNVNTLVSNPERTNSRTSTRDDPHSASSDQNQHSQMMIMGRYRTSRTSRENSIATNGSAGNDASSHRPEELTRKQSTGSQNGGNPSHTTYTNGYHPPHHDVASGTMVVFDSMPKPSSQPGGVRLMDMGHSSGPRPGMVHPN